MRGGVRPARKEAELGASWAAQRVLRLLESGVEGEALREGIEYARAGQSRTFSASAGRIEASVQGRADRAYQTRLTLPVIDPAGWERVTAAMAEQAVYSARLLGGEVPSSIEDAFAPSGLRLFPGRLEDMSAACSCGHPTPWCKHAVCAAYLLADRLAGDAMLMFEIRGIARADLLDRIRAGRSAPPPGVEAPVYIPTAHGDGAEPLEGCVDRFWDAGPGLGLVDLPIEPPVVSHALLRRLGPSPFPEGRFPLVGLLATCYDLVSKRAAEEPIGRDETIDPGSNGLVDTPDHDPGDRADNDSDLDSGPGARPSA